MIRQTTETSHVLEIYGPRNQAFRPVNMEIEPELKEGQRLAWNGDFIAAITEAQDAYIAKHGSMHGIRFRVTTKIVIHSFLGLWEEGTGSTL